MTGQKAALVHMKNGLAVAGYVTLRKCAQDPNQGATVSYSIRPVVWMLNAAKLPREVTSAPCAPIRCAPAHMRQVKKGTRAAQ
jgi:hypothetical protein